MDGWNTSFLLGWPIFRGYVSFRECRSCDSFEVGLEQLSSSSHGRVCFLGTNMVKYSSVPADLVYERT